MLGILDTASLCAESADLDNIDVANIHAHLWEIEGIVKRTMTIERRPQHNLPPSVRTEVDNLTSHILRIITKGGDLLFFCDALTRTARIAGAYNQYHAAYIRRVYDELWEMWSTHKWG